MAVVYILYSPSFRKYYIGSCKDLKERLAKHNAKFFPGAFTSSIHDWDVYFSYPDLEYSLARKIEAHIKKMKNKVYLQNLKKYPEMFEKLIESYKNKC